MINKNPQLFRLNIEVGDLDRAVRFYDQLLGIEGSRGNEAAIYYNCGGVTLQVIDTTEGNGPHPLPKALHIGVSDLENVFQKARELDCVSADDVHGVSGGDIAVSPWGERAFYAYDPWGNPLCFVEINTAALPV